jgi:hypothetical protein
VGAGNEARLLEGATGGDVAGVTAGARNASRFVADAFQFLNEVRAEAAQAKGLRHLHPDVAVGRVVVVEDASGGGHFATNFDEHPVAFRFARTQGCAGEAVVGGEFVFEDDFFADDVVCPGVKH